MKIEIVLAAEQACVGKGIEEAATYVGTGPHPVVVCGHWTYGDTNRFPESWWPESINDLELVACLGEEQEELIETCTYTNGPPLRRYQYKREIRLVEAKTGNIIASYILKGSVPDKCPSATTKKDVERHGSDVGFNEVRNWLIDFVTSQR